MFLPFFFQPRRAKRIIKILSVEACETYLPADRRFPAPCVPIITVVTNRMASPKTLTYRSILAMPPDVLTLRSSALVSRHAVRALVRLEGAPPAHRALPELLDDWLPRRTELAHVPPPPRDDYVVVSSTYTRAQRGLAARVCEERGISFSALMRSLLHGAVGDVEGAQPAPCPHCAAMARERDEALELARQALEG